MEFERRNKLSEPYIILSKVRDIEQGENNGILGGNKDEDNRFGQGRIVLSMIANKECSISIVIFIDHCQR